MPGNEMETGRLRALIIASDQYEDPGLLALRSPSRGANELARTLADDAIGGFEVQTLLNSPMNVLTERIEDFFVDRRPDDIMLLYISCHGILDPSGQLHFAAPTTKINRLASTSISARFVQEQFQQCHAQRTILILDCCYSGAYERGHRPRPEGRAEVGLFEGSGRVVISSSTALEYAFESYTGETTGTPAASVFTTALVEGLRTGDADRDGDGLISVGELYSYIRDRLLEITPRQSPQMLSHIRDDFIIARNPHMSVGQLEYSSPDLTVDVANRGGSAGELAAVPGPSDDLGSDLAYWERVVETLRQDSDRMSLVSALNKVGEIYVMLQHPEDAVSLFEESAAICRDLGNRSGEITSLTPLIRVYSDLGYAEDSTAARRRVSELDRGGR